MPTTMGRIKHDYKMKLIAVNGWSGKLVQLRQRHSTGREREERAAPAWIIPSNLSGLNYKRNREGEREEEGLGGSARLWSPPPRRPHPWPVASVAAMEGGGRAVHSGMNFSFPAHRHAKLPPPLHPENHKNSQSATAMCIKGAQAPIH